MHQPDDHAAAEVLSLHVYPVKSCRGIAVTEWSLVARGLQYDRTWMAVDAATGAFFTQRSHPQMARVAAKITASSLALSAAGVGEVAVPLEAGVSAARRAAKVWDDTVDAIDAGDDAAAFFSAVLGAAARLVRFDPARRRSVDPYWAGTQPAHTGFADMGPLLVIGQGSLDHLNGLRAAQGRPPIPMSRFRPNVVLGTREPHEEDRIASLHLPGDAARIDLVKPCIRCGVTEVEQLTGEVGDTKAGTLATLAPYRHLANARGNRGVMFGQNAIPRGLLPATIRQGDLLHVVHAATVNTRPV